MEIALIGLHGSGKTTLFNALTQGSQEPGVRDSGWERVQVGVTKVPDPRLNALARLFQPQKTTPTEITYWDIPASLAEGGAKADIHGLYLNQLQGADALLLVVRSFEDPTVPHPEGSVDPARDVATMNAEMVLSDLSILERRAQRIETSMKGTRGHEQDLLLREKALLQRIREGLEREMPVRQQQVSADETGILSNYQLLTAKPLLVVFNTDEAMLSNKPAFYARLAQAYDQPGVKVVALCAKLEAEFAQLSPEEEQEFRGSMGVEESGVELLLHQSLALLGLVSFFTFVSQEARAWTVSKDIPAAQAAGRIHSDMERGFIRAEVISFTDLMACGSIAEARKQGLLRSEGRKYPIQDGDVITFLFNV